MEGKSFAKIIWKALGFSSLLTWGMRGQDGTVSRVARLLSPCFGCLCELSWHLAGLRLEHMEQ